MTSPHFRRPAGASRPKLTRSLPSQASSASLLQHISSDWWSLAALEVPLNYLFRRLLKMMPTCATNLLYMSTTYGGAGLPSLVDNVIRRKWNIVHRSLQLGGPSALAMGGLLDRAARAGGYPTRPYAYSHIRAPVSHSWWGAVLGTPTATPSALLTHGTPASPLDHSLWTSSTLSTRAGQAPSLCWARFCGDTFRSSRMASASGSTRPHSTVSRPASLSPRHRAPRFPSSTPMAARSGSSDTAPRFLVESMSSLPAPTLPLQAPSFSVAGLAAKV